MSRGHSPTGYTSAQHFSVVLEVSRTVYDEPFEMYSADRHTQLRFARFGLLWAAIGAQMMIQLAEDRYT